MFNAVLRNAKSRSYMKGTVKTSNGNVKVDTGNPWSEFERWGGKSWFTSHAKEEAEETVLDERAERFEDVEPDCSR
jgi:hypothetical protein